MSSSRRFALSFLALSFIPALSACENDPANHGECEAGQCTTEGVKPSNSPGASGAHGPAKPDSKPGPKPKKPGGPEAKDPSKPKDPKDPKDPSAGDTGSKTDADKDSTAGDPSDSSGKDGKKPGSDKGDGGSKKPGSDKGDGGGKSPGDSGSSDGDKKTDKPDAKKPKKVRPNIGPFVPSIDGIWLQIQPGTNKANFEIVLDPKEREFLPMRDHKVTLAMDVDGEGKFHDMVFHPVSGGGVPKGLHPSDFLNKSIYRSELTIDKDLILAAAREYNQVSQRSIVNFFPGSPEVKSRHVAPRIDIHGLLAGAKVDLTNMLRMFPLKSLGAQPVTVNRDRSLLIRDLAVIEDPARTVNPCEPSNPANLNKAWSFAHLMGEMAKGSGMSTQDFVAHWLDTWSEVQTIRSKDGRVIDQVSADTGAELKRILINDWRNRSGGAELDLSIAPFRLLSIVYRPDLGTSSPMLAPGRNSAGQLRFVFGMMQVRDFNRDGDALDLLDVCRSVEASVIFEYVVPFTGCHETKDWANDILNLSRPDLPFNRYLSQLEKLTEKVVRFGAAPDKPFKNALGQIRTNEIAFSKVWQMREFILPESGNRLVQTTVKDNPRQHDRSLLLIHSSATKQSPSPQNLNKSGVLYDEIKSNIDLILRGRYTMPEFNRSGEPLLGGIATVKSVFHRWDHPHLRSPDELQARFNISVNSCSGCHTGDTGTQFYHIFPSRPGHAVRYSSYLDNSPHRAKFINGNLKIETHEFDETAMRRHALYGLANQSCNFENNMVPIQLIQAPIKRVH